jgi:D-amino-acid oxidase
MYDVVIVGAGVIGLSCARRLQQAGARVVVVAPGGPGATTSALAAAVWYPTRTEADPRVLERAERTFQELSAQAALGVPGVVMRPTRMLLRRESAAAVAPVIGDGRPWWATAVPDFRREPAPAGGPWVGTWRFTVPAVEMSLYLPWLVAQVEEAGGAVLPRRLDRLDDVAGLAPVTVNATGLAAGALTGDDAVHPIRGRILLVENPGLDTSVRDEDDPAGVTYLHPRRRDVVLGGTFEPGETDLAPDPDAEAAILARCVALEPRLAGAPVIARLAGLRPGRTGGMRLESQRPPGGGVLIHNYGHGGAGVTLSWGCADEVVVLAHGSPVLTGPVRDPAAHDGETALRRRVPGQQLRRQLGD